LQTSPPLLWTNCPIGTDPFHRHTYHCVEGSDLDTVGGEWQAFIDVYRAGAFEFFLEFSKLSDGTGMSSLPAHMKESSRVNDSLRQITGIEDTSFLVEAPSAARRGPTSRFVVQPELTLRLLRPLPFAQTLTAQAHAEQQGATYLKGYDTATAALLPGLANDDFLYEEVSLPLPLEGITLQTQLTRCLGPIDWWLRLVRHKDAAFLAGTLAETLACKFNMLHFTPVQQLGGSRSAYSIADQHCLEPSMFASSATVQAAAKAAYISCASNDEQVLACHPIVEGAKLAVLARMVDVLERQHGALSMVDIVLNHTSTDSWWLRRHPEAGYSLRNSPHLRAAFELDETILRVTKAILQGELPGIGADMSSERAVLACTDVLQYHSSIGIPGARLWEFYCMDVTGSLAAAVSMHPSIQLSPVAITQKHNKEGGSAEIPDAAGLVTEHVPEQPLSVERIHEILACKHTLVNEIIQTYNSLGYSHGSGIGSVHISDSDVDVIVQAIMKAPAQQPVADAVQVLREVTASHVAMQYAHQEEVSNSDSPYPGDPTLASTPLPSLVPATPLASPTLSNGTPPAVQTFPGYPYGRPPTFAHVSSPSSASIDLNIGGTGSATAARDIVGRLQRQNIGGSRPSPAYVQHQLTSPMFAGRSVADFVSRGAVASPMSQKGENIEDTFAGAIFNDGTGSRFAVHADLELVLAAIKRFTGISISPAHWVLPSDNSPKDFWGTSSTSHSSLGLLPSLYLIQRVLQGVNGHLYSRYDGDMAAALGAIRGTAKYQWLGVWEGKAQLTMDRPIVFSYFSRQFDAAHTTTHVLACNGFIWNGDPEIDFTLPVDSAKLYADFVRAGTSESSYVKRPRDWSAKRQAEMVGMAISPHADGGQSAGAETTDDTAAHESFFGADLLHFPKYHLQQWVDGVKTLGKASLDNVVHMLAGVHTHDIHTPHQRHVDIDGVPHLRPDVINLPVVTASTPYMRRDIVIWGDCVKLRYGLSPSDNPWLWTYMAIYTKRMASVFQAFRLDNAHGTPLHVAANMLDVARSVRADLYVNAELFTGSLDRDVEYISRLGINSLVREAMQCNAIGDLLQSVYSFGGVPVASLRPSLRGVSAASRVQATFGPERAVPLMKRLFSASTQQLNSTLLLASEENATQTQSLQLHTGMPVKAGTTSFDLVGGFDIAALPTDINGTSMIADAAVATLQNTQTLHRVLLHLNEARVGAVLPAALPALFFDCTHDNAVPAEKRHPADALSTSAVVSASVCASGTTRGFDRLVPHNINVVTDARLYDLPAGVAPGLIPASHVPSLAPCVGTRDKGVPYGVNLQYGILLARRRLNMLKQEMAVRGHNEIFATSTPQPHGSDVLTVIRGHSSLSSSYVFITRAAFTRQALENAHTDVSVTLEGRVTSVVMAACVDIPDQTIRTHAPKGDALRFPALLKADCSRVALGPCDTGADTCVMWTRPGVKEGKSTEEHIFDADPRFINGLHSTLSYCDDSTMFNTPELSAACMGLASFQELDETGREIPNPSDKSVPTAHTRVLLNHSKFTPGSVLVLRLRAPRNVAIRSHSSAKGGDETVPTPTLPAPLATAESDTGADTEDTPRLLSAQTHTGNQHRSVVAAVAFALHGPDSARKPFHTSSSWASMDAMLETCSPNPKSQRLSLLSDVTPPRSIRMPPKSLFNGPSLSALEEALLYEPGVTLVHLNALLYRCESEERDDSCGSRGVYNVPDMGLLPWAGIAGPITTLQHCRRWNDLSHPLLENVRRGSWLMDYTVQRLAAQPKLAKVREWMQAHFDILKRMPPGLRPQGFDRVITAVYHVAVAAALVRMPSPLFPVDMYSHSQHYLVSVFEHLTAEDASDDGDDETPEMGEEGGEERGEENIAKALQAHTDPAAPLPFLTALALTSVQLFGVVRSAPLMALPMIEAAEETEVFFPSNGAGAAVHDGDSAHPGGTRENALVALPASLAAGVSHFCTGYMRNWGRDTFISLRGLLLTTGRFQEARQTILAYATVVRHGLIPNLMDGGQNPRYNCRDAAWWFLQSIKDYCDLAPEHTAILDARVHRRFPSDDMSMYGANGAYTGVCPPMRLEEIIHEILDRHARGIHFREWRAGSGIDAHMKDEGFNIDISTNASTGFIHGGNAYNCGTWMDKMGSSTTHGNEGIPATPRDGADIEIVALSFSVLHWLAGLVAAGSEHVIHSSVIMSDGTQRTYAEWASRIQASFEAWFYIPASADEDPHYHVNSSICNARGIYKDTVGSSAGWSDYQLRPNQLVAFVVAPQLFNPGHVELALCNIERQLLGEHQLGVKTLDPSDWAYRGDYNNSSDVDKATGKGWNYHQGPEWLWPYGFYLRARLTFPPAAFRQSSPHKWSSYQAMRRWVFSRLARHRKHMETCAEGGLPELTNSNGQFCADSCVSQAWSSSTILDALYDVHQMAHMYEDGGLRT
jgi:glycogen debranching enzyme